jgi:glycine/D-amino acid oxidase-like deaminating enzyme
MFNGRIQKIGRLPEYDAGNAWYNILPPPLPPRRLKGTVKADWAVLGAGACGLTFARRLAELRPDTDIAIIDASRVGYGASGRNAGFMLNHNTHGEVKDFKVERRNNRLCEGGCKHLKQLVDENQIACDWSDWGRLYVAAAEQGDAHLTDLQENYRKLGLPQEMVDGTSLAEMLGTPFYRRGLRSSGNGLVNPAALMRGLARTLPANVTLYEDSPIQAFATGQPHSLIGAEGEISCRNLVLANSVFLEDMKIVRGRIVPIATFGSLSKPLTPAQRAQLGTAEEFALLPAHPNGSTVRLMRDGRLLMRNCIRYARNKTIGDSDLEQISEAHRDSIARRWPGLKSLEFEGTWGGLLGFTRNDGTIWGEIGDRIFGVISSDASPFTRGAMAGKLLADQACDLDSELLQVMRSLPHAAILPPDPFLRFMVNRRIRSLETLGAREV